LAGRALNHEEWRVISLPALAEPNDPLGRHLNEPLWCDDSYGYGNQLVELSKVTPARTWSALYQQRPAPEEGDYFRDEWLVPYDRPPSLDVLRIYGASDYAVTADGGDYTVHVVVGIDPKWRIYLLDLWRKQSAADEWIESFCDLVQRWKPLGWAEETGQIRAGVGPFIERRMRERQTYVARAQFPTRHDKAIRAQSIRGRMGVDGLFVPMHAPWYPELRSELLSFPAGKHDDQVDALGLIGQVLDRMSAGALPKPPEKVRYANEMTMDEAWNLARPKRPGADARI
jgi:predicted phage terminase large subunit-like protein